MQIRCSFARCLPRRLLAALLCAGLCLSLFACGQKPTAPGSQSEVNYAQLVDAMDQQLTDATLENMKQIIWCTATQDHILMYGMDYDIDPDDPHNIQNQQYLLTSLKPNGTVENCIELTLPEVTDATPQLKEMLETDAPQGHDIEQGYDYPIHSLVGAAQRNGGEVYLLLEESVYHYSQDAQGQIKVDLVEYLLTLCTLEEDGAVQRFAALDLPQGVEYGRDMLFDDTGALWVSAKAFTETQGWLLRYSLDDNRQKIVSLPKDVTFMPALQNCVCLLPENKLAVLGCTESPDGQVYADSVQLYLLADITDDAPVWQDPQALPNGILHNAQGVTTSVLGFVPAVGTVGPTVGLSTGNGFYRWDYQNNKTDPWNEKEDMAQAWLTWQDFGVTPWEGEFFCVDLGNEQTLAITRTTGWPPAPYQLHLLTPLDPDVVSDRTVLTLAGTDVMSEPVQSVINSFNAASEQYFVQTVDYGYHAAQEKGFGSGREMLKRDIINNNMPDIVFADLLDESTFSKGTLIDLYPYIDADPELSREDLLPGVLKATERDGELTSIMANFGFYTLVGPASLVGETPGWTWAEYDALCAAHPDAMPVFNMGRLQILLFMIQQGGDKYLDSAARQAHFDDPSFAHLLEATAAYPEQPDYSQLDPKPGIEQQKVLMEFQPYAYWRRIWNQHYVYGDDFTFIGFPNDEGKSGAFITPGIQLGISSSCQDPDVAWQLVRQFLLPEFQEQVANESSLLYFPARMDALQHSAELAMQPGTQHWRSGYTLPDPNNLENDVQPSDYFKQAISQQDADKIWEILLSLDTLGTSDEAVINILAEEAEAFYNGQRSAEDAAKIIQDRVQTYLDEQS